MLKVHITWNFSTVKSFAFDIWKFPLYFQNQFSKFLQSSWNKTTAFIFIFISKKLRKTTKTLITKVHRVQQTMWQDPIQSDREGWNVCLDSLMVYLPFQGGFLSGLNVTSYSRDTEHQNLQKWVNRCSLTNDGRQQYRF